MRAFLGIVVAVLLAGAGAAPASAAEWVEQRGWSVPRDGVADCLAAAGPGQLTALGPLGPSAPTQLLRAGDGLAAAGRTTLGWLQACPAVAAAPGQPTLLAAPVYAPRARRWQLRVAAVGGRPATLRSYPALESILPAAAAQAPSGAAAVAWYEIAKDADGRWRRRLAVATRPRAGAPFGAPRAVATDTTGDVGTAPALGTDAAGTFTLAWQSTDVQRGRRILSSSATHVATVAADGTVSGVQRLTDTLNENGLALAVAPDGGALVATGGPRDELVAYERAPGAAAFAPVALRGGRNTGGKLAVALSAGGGAVVVDRAEPDTVVAWTRTAGGAFSPPLLLAGRRSHESSGFGFYLPDERPRRPQPPIAAEPPLATAIGADGGVLVTWIDPSDARSADAVRVVRGTLAGGFGRPHRLNGACRTGDMAKPIARADGTLAVAWTDNAAASRASRVDADVRGGGRVHLAAPAAGGDAPLPGAAPIPPRPRPATAVRAGGPGLRVSAPLRVRVRCAGGPCDVRATVIAENPAPPRDPADPPPAAGDDERFGVTAAAPHAAATADRRDAAAPPRAAAPRAAAAAERRDTAATGDGWSEEPAHQVAPLVVSDALALAAGAAGELRLTPRPGYRAGRIGARSARVLLTTCNAGGAAVERRVVELPLRATPPRPVPWLRDVRLRREGARMRLSWRTAAPAVHTRFLLTPMTRGGYWVRPPIRLRGRGRDRFEVVFAAPRRTATVDLSVWTPEWSWGTDDAVARLPR